MKKLEKRHPIWYLERKRSHSDTMKMLHIDKIIGTENAIIHKFGLQVFEEASNYLSKGEKVLLDFSKVRNATTGFFNASIGNLFKRFQKDFFELVETKGLKENPDWKEKFDEAIELVRNPHRATEIDKAISALFDE